MVPELLNMLLAGVAFVIFLAPNFAGCDSAQAGWTVLLNIDSTDEPGI